jgi:hypothetical protein
MRAPQNLTIRIPANRAVGNPLILMGGCPPVFSTAATPDNIPPFPAAPPLTKIPISSIITKNKRMWRNLADAQASGACGVKPVEVRLLSSAVRNLSAAGGFKVGGCIRPIK